MDSNSQLSHRRLSAFVGAQAIVLDIEQGADVATSRPFAVSVIENLDRDLIGEVALDVGRDVNDPQAVVVAEHGADSGGVGSIDHGRGDFAGTARTRWGRRAAEERQRQR